jgi:hypothetical protein
VKKILFSCFGVKVNGFLNMLTNFSFHKIKFLLSWIFVNCWKTSPNNVTSFLYFHGETEESYWKSQSGLLASIQVSNDKCLESSQIYHRCVNLLRVRTSHSTSKMIRYGRGFEVRNVLLVNPMNHWNCASTIRYEEGVQRTVRQTEFVPKWQFLLGRMIIIIIIILIMRDTRTYG